MCCLFPCLRCLERRCPDLDKDLVTIVITEILRWIVLVVPLFLTTWRYAVMMGYPNESSLTTGEYWAIASGCILGGSFLIYLPAKVVLIIYRLKHRLMKGLYWRPSILTYIILSGAPCLTLVAVAAKTSAQSIPPNSTLDPTTLAVLQVTVLGLTFTEWMSKMREEILTYDLLTAMADDFFYAYDVIEFIWVATHEAHIYHSDWLYACFIFAFVSMFKYVPSQPTYISGQGGTRTVVNILVNMFCCDIPFLVIRLATLVVFGFVVSDLLHPATNVALIVFGCMQLYIVYTKRKARNNDTLDPLNVPNG